VAKANLNFSRLLDMFREYFMMIKDRHISLVVLNARKRFFKIEKGSIDVIIAIKLCQRLMQE